MTAIIISNQGNYTWGSLTNRMTGAMIQCNTNIERLNEAIATASAGYTGTPGTQFEVSSAMTSQPTNLFGVVADPDNEGKHGQDYAYAVGRLHELWGAFWEQAKPFVEQLDNGTGPI